MDTKDKDVSMQLAEDARQAEWENVSFTAEVFKGSFRWDLLHPFPAQSADDKRIGDEYIEKIRPVIEKFVDPWKIDAEGEYPPEALDAMAAVGLFGMKIPKEYGGLGFSVTNYARVLGFLGSYCASTVAYVSAHQSIGVPQPLKEFGTEEQKRKYLPRLARGEISAFALTEPGVGSDPARMATTAKLSADGRHYLLNGDKLWCTNVTDPKTTLIAVLARTPDKVLPNGKKLPQISCFVVETAWPGVERVRRSRFMGLRGIANGVVTFKDVKVPVENLIGKPGEGLEDRAGDAECRSPRHSGRSDRWRHGAGRGREVVDVDPAAVGPAGRQAPGRREDGRELHGAAVRDEGHGRRRVLVCRPQERRHPPRGRRGEVLLFRDALEDVRRLPAGARRARLRERASRSTSGASARSRSRWACATHASTASSRARRRSCT